MTTHLCVILGAILGTVLGTFLILNSKITQIKSNTEYILAKLRGIDGRTSDNTNSINTLLIKLNDKSIVDNANYKHIKSRFTDLDNATDTIFDKLNTINNDFETLIIGEHKITRDSIKKQAKNSSKKHSNTKTKKAITHTKKHE